MPISARHERRADPRGACSAREGAAICRAERMRRATAIGHKQSSQRLRSANELD